MSSASSRLSPLLGLVLLVPPSFVGCKGKGGDGGSETKYEPPPRQAYSVDSYAELCSAGDAAQAAFPAAPKYDKKKSPADLSKAVVFRKYMDDPKATFQKLSPEGLTGFVTDDPKQVELVACVEARKLKFNAQCSYYGGKVELFDMKTKVVIYEAATGKEVAKEEVDLGASAMRCWGSYNFPNGVNSVFEGPDVSPKVLSMLLPLEPGGASLPEVKSPNLTTVCDGLPFPQAAKYEPAKKGKRSVHVSYRAIDKYPYDREDLPAGLPAKADPPPVPKDVQLVACVTGQPAKKVRDCSFSSGSVLELYDGEVEVALREAHTAKIVETKKFKATAGDCPFSYKFFGSKDTWFGKIDPSFAAWIKTLEGG